MTLPLLAAGEVATERLRLEIHQQPRAGELTETVSRSAQGKGGAEQTAFEDTKRSRWANSETAKAKGVNTMTIPDIAQLLNMVSGMDELTFQCFCTGEERTFTTANYTVLGNTAWTTCPTHDAARRRRGEAAFDESLPQHHVVLLDVDREGLS